MKTLLIYGRVCDNPSLHTIKIFNMLKELDNITAIKLDANQHFDVAYEQEFIQQFDNIIILFTINWCNIPWDLSRYFKEVWTSDGFNLKNKKVYQIITSGGSLRSYTPEGPNKTLLTNYLINLDGLYKAMQLNKVKDYIYYGCAKYDEKRLNEFVEMLKKEYLNKINKCLF